MFCPNCGRQVAPGATFCGNCGNPMNVAGQAGAATPMYNQAQGNPAAPMYNAGQMAPDRSVQPVNNSSVMNCPHCGGVMYKLLSTCPHCHGPVLSPELQMQRAYEQEMTRARDERDWQQYCAEVNKTEKRNFWLSMILGLAIALAPIISASINGNLGEANILELLLFIYGLQSWIYGLFCLRISKRFAFLIELVIIGWIILLYIVMSVPIIIGAIYWVPKAVCRLIIGSPLLSEKEIEKMLEKGLLD